MRFPCVGPKGPRNKGHYSEYSWRVTTVVSRKRFSQNKLRVIREGKTSANLKTQCRKQK